VRRNKEKRLYEHLNNGRESKKEKRRQIKKRRSDRREKK
jgi:hypothetical protein